MLVIYPKNYQSINFFCYSIAIIIYNDFRRIFFLLCRAADRPSKPIQPSFSYGFSFLRCHSISFSSCIWQAASEEKGREDITTADFAQAERKEIPEWRKMVAATCEFLHFSHIRKFRLPSLLYLCTFLST